MKSHLQLSIQAKWNITDLDLDLNAKFLVEN